MTDSLSKDQWITRQLKNQRWRQRTGGVVGGATARKDHINPQSQRLKKFRSPSPSMGGYSTQRANPPQLTKAHPKELKSKRQARG